MFNFHHVNGSEVANPYYECYYSAGVSWDEPVENWDKMDNNEPEHETNIAGPRNCGGRPKWP